MARRGVVGSSGRRVQPIADVQGQTLAAVVAEVKRARGAHADPRHALAVLVEKSGKLASAARSHDAREVRRRAIQVATMAIRIYEEGDAAFNDRSRVVALMEAEVGAT